MDSWQALADEHGLIRAGDARGAGMTARELRRLVTGEHLVHLGHGWYALPFPMAAEGAQTWERRRRLRAARTRAAVVAHAGQAIASHHSALVAHGLPTFAADLGQVHLTRAGDPWSRRRGGLTVHRQVVGATAADRVIAPAVAVVQAGCVNGPMASLIAADAAIHCGLVTAEDLAEASALVLAPGASAVRRLLLRADGRAESPGETRLRHAVQVMGFAVTPQVWVSDGALRARVDLMLDDAPVVLEFDGFMKYARPTPTATFAAPADIVAAEKLREDHLRDLGYEVVRVIWSELDDLPALRRRIEAARARALLRAGGVSGARRPGRPR